MFISVSLKKMFISNRRSSFNHLWIMHICFPFFNRLTHVPTIPFTITKSPQIQQICSWKSVVLWVFTLRNQITDQTRIRWVFFTVSKIIKACLFFSNVHQWVYSLDLDDKTACTDAKNSGCKWQDSTVLYFLVFLFTIL